MSANLLQHKSLRLMKPTRGHQPHKETGEIRPTDTLVDRCQQWKHIAKSLLNYYKGLSQVSLTASKQTSALTELIQVPFHEGHQFLGEGGWQEVLYEVRDKTRDLAELHLQMSQTIDSTAVAGFEEVRSKIKAHIAAIEKEAGTLADDVEKQRALSATHLTNLQNGIESFTSSEQAMLPQFDPYITHTQSHHQLLKQITKENELQAALIRFQQAQPGFESEIADQLKETVAEFEAKRVELAAEIDKLEVEIAATLQTVPSEAEFDYFASIEGNVLDPNTPFRSAKTLYFPGQNHASTIPIKTGYLERKKRFTKTYKEGYYVLTPSGYLHERVSNDDVNAIVPQFSLFLPECSLGPPSKESDRSHKFHIEGNKANKSRLEGKLKNSVRFGGKEIAYTFRARTHAEMLAWWEQMDKLTRDTKPAAPEKRAAVTPVSQAVASAGYPVEESSSIATGEELDAEEDDEDYEEASSDEEGLGSSAEEEEENEIAPVTAAVENVTLESEQLPDYTGSGLAGASEKEALAEKGVKPVLEEGASTSN